MTGSGSIAAPSPSAGLSPGSQLLEIVRVPCLSDNYVWLLHDPVAGVTGALVCACVCVCVCV